MQSQAQRLIFLFRSIILAAVTALLITAAALPLPAQNAVPASAVEASKKPEVATRLHPSRPPAAGKPGASTFRHASPQDDILYDNGPVNGTVDAWTINSGYAVSDSVEAFGTPTAIEFYTWLLPGDTLIYIDVALGSEPFGSDLFYATISPTASNCSTNQFGYEVCLESGNIVNGPLLNGTAWMTLQNASVGRGDPVYWDENSGTGCQSPGCPSQAYDSAVGTIPSEAFTMLGNAEDTCFRSGGNLQIIYNLTQQQGGGQDGVTIDKSGNLYGATPNGGDSGAGFAFKLTHFADWLLDPLFSFPGGSSGGGPQGVLVSPNGSLYGGAQGGVQNCGSDGSQYCGLVYNLTPQPTACRTALCSWTENVPYRFSSESDGSGGIAVSASDQEGNLYGTTSSGGAYDAGTVFELMPSGGSWMKTTLYSFSGGNDGGTPTQVLVGNDGNLYGVASGGNGVVFQLAPAGGGQWTESVLHTFQSAEGGDPSYLVQDSAGNLYGIVSPPSGTFGSRIFVLEKGSGWAFSEDVVQHSCAQLPAHFENLNNLAIDAAGKLYGTGSGSELYRDGRHHTGSGDLECYYGYIFKAWYASGGWHYQDLDFLDHTYFDSGGSLALDPSGNLYGTTSDCGSNGAGTVWQFSP